MRLGPPIPCDNGDEYDVFTGWRRVVSRFSRAGQTKRVKRRYNRRVRRTARSEVVVDTAEVFD